MAFRVRPELFKNFHIHQEIYKRKKSRCQVENCSGDVDASMHTVTSRNRDLRNSWMKALNFNPFFEGTIYVCGNHFKDTDFAQFRDNRIYVRLKRNAVPSINLPKKKKNENEDFDCKINEMSVANEISLTTVKNFYARNKDLFDVAVDAVVRGCVNNYFFDHSVRKFVGTVTSFDGIEMYKVEITLDHMTGIKMTACECPEHEICYHIGALALHSGYDAPIFSYENTTDDSTSDDGNPNDHQPFQEVYVKSEKLEPDKVISTQQIKIEKFENNSTASDSNVTLEEIKAEISVNEEPDAADHFIPTNEKVSIDEEQQKFSITCEKCDKIFDNKFQFDVHHRYSHRLPVHKIPMFQCGICTIRKHTKVDMELHMKKKHPSKECNVCGLFFSTVAIKNEHFRKAHWRMERKKYLCEKCPRYFFTEKGIYLHNLNDVHYKFKCIICCKTFNRSGHYNRHLRGVHGMEPSTKGPVTKEPVEKKYECKICSLTFPTFVQHHKHLRTHPTIFQSFKCAVCGQGFETEKALTTHKMRHKIRIHECKKCDRIFSKGSELYSHCEEAHSEPQSISDPHQNDEISSKSNVVATN